MKAFVQSVTAAAVGAIAGAAFILGRRSLIDLSTVSIPLLTFGLLSFKKIPEPILILAAGVAGFLLLKGRHFISVFQMDDPDHYRKLEDFPVQKKVHSLAVDFTTHRVYGPEQEADGKPVARMGVYEANSKR